jgi:hypothetical protein
LLLYNWSMYMQHVVTGLVTHDIELLPNLVMACNVLDVDILHCQHLLLSAFFAFLLITVETVFQRYLRFYHIGSKRVHRMVLLAIKLCCSRRNCTSKAC